MGAEKQEVYFKIMTLTLASLSLSARTAALRRGEFEVVDLIHLEVVVQNVKELLDVRNIP